MAGKVERLRLFKDSLGTAPGSSWPTRSGASPSVPDAARQRAVGFRANDTSGLKNPSSSNVDEDRSCDITDEEGFYILTVSDEKWVSPDLPPEAGVTKALGCGAASNTLKLGGRSAIGGQHGRSLMGGRAPGRSGSNGISPTPHHAQQQQQQQTGRPGLHRTLSQRG